MSKMAYLLPGLILLFTLFSPVVNGAPPAPLAAQGSALLVPPPAAGHEQGFPYASDSFLIWTDSTRTPEGYVDDSHDRVLGLDLRTNTPITVTDAPGAQFALGISGAVTLWAYSSSANGTRHIAAKDLATGQTYSIAAGTADQPWAAISGGSVVWQDYEVDGARIMLGHLDGRAPQVITTLPTDAKLGLAPPVISANYIVWAEEWQGSYHEAQTEDSRLLAYDRRSGTTRVLYEYGYLSMGRVEYSLWNNRLLWIDPDVHYLDLDSGSAGEIAQGGFILAPRIFGDTLLWSAGQPNDQDLYGATLVDNVPHLLVGGPGSQLAATLSGGTLIWNDNSGHPPSTIRSAQLAQLFDLAIKREQALRPQTASPAGADIIVFPQTEHTLRGRFRAYWQEHGGLAQQGYPISEEFQEVSPTDGKIYTVQYFQRAVFEYHPENSPPYDVLLSLVGSAAYQARYAYAGYNPTGAPGQRAGTVNPRFFPQTGKTLAGVFRSYWEQHGGLAQQGYPLSDEFAEQSLTDGRTYTVQYFERAVFEYHPENKGSAAEVLLSLLGTATLDQRYIHPGQWETAPPQPSLDPGVVDSNDLNAVRMDAADDAWAVGAGGTILHFDGQRWTRQISNTSADLSDIAMLSASEGWAVGDNTILHFINGAWQPVAVPDQGNITSIQMLSPTSGWAACQNCASNLLVYLDGYWRKTPVAGVRAAQLSIADGYGWAVGGASLRYRDGGWYDASADLNNKATLRFSSYVQSLPGDEAWALCGDLVSFCHYAGGAWEIVPGVIASQFVSLHMLSSTEGWAVGYTGVIAHYAGGIWARSASPTINTLTAADLLTANEGWAVGRGGVILRLVDGDWQLYKQ